MKFIILNLSNCSAKNNIIKVNPIFQYLVQFIFQIYQNEYYQITKLIQFLIISKLVNVTSVKTYCFIYVLIFNIK